MNERTCGRCGQGLVAGEASTCDDCREADMIREWREADAVRIGWDLAVLDACFAKWD